MQFEDERYVRLYTRKTVGWKLLPWQSRALLPLIMKELDRAGILSLDAVDPVEAVVALTDMPAELVAPGLSGLMKAEVILVSPAELVMPNFLEAQECVQSDAQRQKESRGKRAAAGMVRVRSGGSDKWVSSCNDSDGDSETGHSGSQRVTGSQSGSQGHSSGHSSRAVPSVPSVPPVPISAKRAKKPRVIAAPDPRHAPLIEKLTAEYKKTTGAEYAFDGGRDAKAVKSLIPKGPDEEILQRWRRGLTAPPGWLSVSNIFELNSKFNNLRPTGSQPGSDVRKGVAEVDESAWANGGDGGYGKLRDEHEKKKAGHG